MRLLMRALCVRCHNPVKGRNDMKIIRYSLSGFKPQYQSYHLEHSVKPHLELNFDISIYPEYLKAFIQENHEKLFNFYSANYHLLKSGIWAFIDGEKRNQSLNHLSRKVPCWEAEIDDDVLVVGCNWDRIYPITASEAKLWGFFIPEPNMKSIRNIQRRKRR